MAWTVDALSHSSGLRLDHWLNMIRWIRFGSFQKIVTAIQCSEDVWSAAGDATRSRLCALFSRQSGVHSTP